MQCHGDQEQYSFRDKREVKGVQCYRDVEEVSLRLCPVLDVVPPTGCSLHVCLL